MTPVSVLLVPDNNVDVVTPELGQAQLHFGGVIAAIDRTEANRAQLSWASSLAGLARQPLLLLTVIESGDKTSREEATEALRELTLDSEAADQLNRWQRELLRLLQPAGRTDNLMTKIDDEILHHHGDDGLGDGGLPARPP